MFSCESWESFKNTFFKENLRATASRFRFVRQFIVSSPFHCVKSVRILSHSAPYFPEFGLKTERYPISLRIQSKCGKIRTRVTLNTDTF